MLIADTDTLQIELSEAHTTAAVQVYVVYTDGDSDTLQRTIVPSNGATVQPILSNGPGRTATIRQLAVYNDDTVSHGVTLSIKVGVTTTPVYTETIAAGYTLEYIEGVGFKRKVVGGGGGSGVWGAITGTLSDQTDLQSELDAKQAYDAELAALAGLTSAADKGIQFTGAGTAATFDLTTAGKALLDDADATAQRATLGLVIGTDVQAYDAELAALAGLTSAADKGIQFTGAGTAATFDLTTAGKALLDDADATAQRATLGLVIGTDVQAYDAELAALAGLTSAADKGIQFTGAGTAATFDLTAAGKALLDDATAADQRATLSIGAYTQSDTAPTSPVNGDKWLDTTTGTEYVRYDSQWISDAPASNLTTLAYRAITALLTLDSSDYTADCTANSFAVTLPTAVGIGGRVYNIKNTGNGLITVATTSNQTIDGAASGTITLAQYACLTIQSTGANWIIL